VKFSKLVKLLLAFILVVPFPAFIYDAGQKANAETALDPPPFIPHHGTLKGRVLFDNTHGETAGAADWVIDGAFSDFAQAIADQGYDVTELRQTTPITYDDLKDYDVFVLGESNIPFKKSEQDAMLEYVQNGGSIFFIGDHYNSDRNLNRWDSGEVFNGFRRGAWDDPTKGMAAEEANSQAMQGVESSDWLGENFGVRFRTNALGDITSGETVVSPDQSFGITQGVSTVEMHAGSTLAILDPKKAKGLIYLPENPPAWGPAVDQGVYNNGGIDEGAFAAIAKVGKGKAAFLGDSSPVEDSTPKYLREDTGKAKVTYDGFSSEGDDSTFLINTILWLAHHEDYTSFDQVPGLQLSEPTPLYDWEQPQNTTEPQHEPWADPPAGYKWYDPSTFAPGSYGSDQEVATNPVYSFVHQETLPNQEPFQIRLSVTNLMPGQTLDHLKIGIYQNGGTQIAKFKDANGQWMTNYGYSPEFSVTADATGNAHIDLDVQINPSYVGTANLRLKVDGDNALTESVRIDNVPAEPLPPYEVPVPDLSKIAEARNAADGTTVTVEGIITTPPGVWGAKGFYLQDSTGGIYVYQSDSTYSEGQKVKLSAVKSTYNGEVELTNIIKLTDEGRAPVPDPKIVSKVDETNQGELLTLQHVTVKNIGTPDKFGTFEFDAVNGETTNRVRVDSRSGMDYNSFTSRYAEGSVLDITGIGSVFKGTYQLKPRSASDFSLAEIGDHPVHVQLLGINDLHGKIDQHYADLDVNGDGQPDGTFGGADYLAAYLSQKASEETNTLLVGVGDLIGGSSPVSALFQDEPTVEILNAMGMDVAVPGNHEFDEGLTELLRMVNGGDYPGDDVNRPYNGMDFPMIAANIVYKDTGETVFKPYEVKTFAGQKIAFIGVDTPATAGMVMPDGIKDIAFIDPVQAINRAVDGLHKEGIHAIVVIAHSPAHQEESGNITDEAAEIAKKVDDDVDVIFAGHNHEVANGVVDGKLVIEASEYGKAFSDVDLTIDPETSDIVEKSGQVVWVNDGQAQPDETVSQILTKYEDLVQDKLNEVIGTAAIDMNGGYAEKGAIGDNALGNLIADGMRHAMHSDFALMNGGGIRDNLEKGEITWNDLFNIQPFGNTLVKLEVTGADLKEILRRQLSAQYGPDYSISGFKYTWTVKNGTPEIVDVTLPNGEKLKEDKTYTVTVNNFMAQATAYKYRIIGERGKNPVQGPEDIDATVAFVKSFKKPIAYKAEGRISEIYTITPDVTVSKGTANVTVTDEAIAGNVDHSVLVLDIEPLKNKTYRVLFTASQVKALIDQNVPIVIKKANGSITLPIENFTKDKPAELFVKERKLLQNKWALINAFTIKLKQGNTELKRLRVPAVLSFSVGADKGIPPKYFGVYLKQKGKRWQSLCGRYTDQHITVQTTHFGTFVIWGVRPR